MRECGFDQGEVGSKPSIVESPALFAVRLMQILGVEFPAACAPRSWRPTSERGEGAEGQMGVDYELLADR